VQRYAWRANSARRGWFSGTAFGFSGVFSGQSLPPIFPVGADKALCERLMSTDPFEPLMTFKPRIAGKRSEVDPHRVPLLRVALKRRLQALAKQKQPAGEKRYSGIAGVAEPTALSRRCLVKAHYVPMDGGGRDAARLHLDYLERDGVERDGSGGALYGADDTFDRDVFTEQLLGERRQFRFIVSPEDAGELDLRTFCRELMARMSEDLGQPLLWAAVDHHNTEHPHIHIVVRGVDAGGNDVRIPGVYIARDMRWRAQEIATRELGLRSEHDIARQRSAEVTQERVTSLDRRLAELAGTGTEVRARDLAKLRGRDRELLLGRLRVLKDLALAQPGFTGAWTLADGWMERLRALSERGDIIKRLHNVAGGDVSRYRIGGLSDVTAPVDGVVRGKGLHDELRGDLFVAVETTAGDTHYIRLDSSSPPLKAGDVVRLNPVVEPWVKPTDVVIARQAAAAAGTYDPTRHLAELKALPARPGASPADLVAGNVRRLERLERYGLVQRQPTGAWRIPVDLVQQLESRERTHPRRLLRVEVLGADLRTQATYPGPTWLDSQRVAQAGRALWGFGAQLAAAVSARAAFLRGRGLDPSRPSFTADLEAAEHQLLTHRLARELGAAPADQAGTLHGTLTLCPALPSGRVYARVFDECAKRFVIAKLTPELRRLDGRLVDLSIDDKGRLNLRPVRRLNRGDT
jgi:type IV secretory pathway VirD2 relaxase